MGTSVDALPGWGEPIATWTYSTDVETVSFTNLGGYRELLVWGDGLTTNTAATSGPGLLLSNDNGGSWLATGYSNGGSATTTAFFVSTAGASSVTHGFVFNLMDFNTSRKPIYFGWSANIGAAGVGTRMGTRAAGPYNAIQIINTNAGDDFTAGSIRVFGRR